MDPEVVARMHGRRRQGSSIAELSPRELEVMPAMAEGKSSRGIAEVLVISHLPAMEKHFTEILGRLGIDGVETGHRRGHAILTYLRES